MVHEVLFEGMEITSTSACMQKLSANIYIIATPTTVPDINAKLG